MNLLSRRSLLQNLLLATAVPAFAQQGQPSQTPPQSAVPAPNPFRYEDVVQRARELASVAYDPATPPLPEP